MSPFSARLPLIRSVYPPPSIVMRALFWGSESGEVSEMSPENRMVPPVVDRVKTALLSSAGVETVITSAAAVSSVQKMQINARTARAGRILLTCFMASP